MGCADWSELARPAAAPFRVPLLAARTLNATDGARVMLSLRSEHLSAGCQLRQEERGLKTCPKRRTAGRLGRWSLPPRALKHAEGDGTGDGESEVQDAAKGSALAS